MPKVAETCAEGTAHAWTPIGATTFTGPTWRHGAVLLYCAGCKRYASRTTLFADMRRLPAAEVEHLRAEETAARDAVLAEHRAAHAEQSAEGS